MLYRIAIILGRIWLWLCGVTYIGRENIPRGQAVLAIANHISYGDPVLMGCAFPQPIHFIAKEGFSQRWITRFFYGKLGAVFLKAEESDLTALRTSIKMLKAGQTVGIYPEGRRNREQGLAEFMPGAAYIAYKAQVPVVPVGICNSQNTLRFWKRDMVVNIGQPILLSFEEKATSEYLAAASAEFRQAVEVLLEQNDKLLLAK